MYPNVTDAVALRPETLSEPELAELRRAVALLEADSLVSRVSTLLGRPMDSMLAALPAGAHDAVQRATGIALRTALDGAVRTVPASGAGLTRWRWMDRQLSAGWFHKAATAVTGAGGGFAGLPGVLAELPVTTALMLRSIAQIGAEEGEDVWSGEGRRQCLQVFAFGGPARGDDEADTGYIAVRIALSELVTSAASQPLRAFLPGFVLAIAERFGAQVSVKVAGQAIPVIGAAAGGIINVLFTDHFQAKARGHFIVRRLERRHGWEAVRTCYDRLAQERRAPKETR